MPQQGLQAYGQPRFGSARQPSAGISVTCSNAVSQCSWHRCRESILQHLGLGLLAHQLMLFSVFHWIRYLAGCATSDLRSWSASDRRVECMCMIVSGLYGNALEGHSQRLCQVS